MSVFAFAAVVLGASVLAALVTAAAFARFFDPETWRVESRWARWPRTAAAIERVAFVRLDPVRALIFWLVLTGVVLAFFGVPTLVYLLSRL